MAIDLNDPVSDESPPDEVILEWPHPKPKPQTVGSPRLRVSRHTAAVTGREPATAFEVLVAEAVAGPLCDLTVEGAARRRSQVWLAVLRSRTYTRSLCIAALTRCSDEV